MNGLISISILLILVSRCHTNWTSEWEDVVENYVKNELSQTIRICVEFDSIEVDTAHFCTPEKVFRVFSGVP